MNRRHFDQTAVEGNRFITDFIKYGEGFMATTGVLYVFLILSGLSCNQFAFEHAGMRTLVLSPVERKRILLGKNIAICTVALTFSAGVLQSIIWYSGTLHLQRCFLQVLASSSSLR